MELLPFSWINEYCWWLKSVWKSSLYLWVCLDHEMNQEHRFLSPTSFCWTVIRNLLELQATRPHTTTAFLTRLKRLAFVSSKSATTESGSFLERDLLVEPLRDSPPKEAVEFSSESAPLKKTKNYCFINYFTYLHIIVFRAIVLSS